MAKKDTFDKMYDLYNAIVDIDKIVNAPDEINQNGECKLDQVLFYVRDIPKTEYDDQYSAQIIQSIRSAIVEMYSRISQEINNDISSGTKPAMGCRQDPPFKFPQFTPPDPVHNFGLGAVKNNRERGSVYAAGQTD